MIKQGSKTAKLHGVVLGRVGGVDGEVAEVVAVPGSQGYEETREDLRADFAHRGAIYPVEDCECVVTGGSGALRMLQQADLRWRTAAVRRLQLPLTGVARADQPDDDRATRRKRFP